MAVAVRFICAALLATLLAAADPASADSGPIPPPLPDGFARGDSGVVAAVADGDTLTLIDGRIVRLVGIQAPKLPLGRPGFQAWPLAGTARAALERMVLGRVLHLYFGGNRQDRYGRALAQLVREDGLWVQGAMLARGLARVMSFGDNRKGVHEMLAIERAARRAGRGIWADPFYRIRTAAEAGRYVGSFQLVEGKVTETAVVNGRGYINFGADWHTDFTVSVPGRALKPMRAAFGRRLERLAGHRIRVRGWLRAFDGPMIEATHPEQIEVPGP